MRGALGRLSSATGVAAVALLALYPVAAYLSLKSFRPAWLAGLLIVASLVRLLTARLAGARISAALWLVPVAGIGLAAFSVLRSTPNAMLFYPALVNGALLAVFGASVVWPPTVVERIARLRDGALPPEAIRYTRRVTIAWAAFFVVNGTLALYTACCASLGTWALYNGFVAYLMIGAMFAGEYWIRRRVLGARRR